MSTQILTTTNNQALYTAQPWKNPIRVMPDGSRLVAYTDGTDLWFAMSQTGATWVTQKMQNNGASICGTLGNLQDVCVTPANLNLSTSTQVWAGVASGTTITLYGWTYSGPGGISGAPTIESISVGNVTSIRLVADATNGNLFVLADLSTLWSLFHVGVTSAGTISSASNLSFGGDHSNGATNAILQSEATLYAVTMLSSGSWFDAIYTYASGWHASGHPPLFNVPSGAALCLSDTSANPGIDLMINAGGELEIVNRSSTGTFTSSRGVGGPNLVGAPTLSLNTTNGTELCLAVGTFGGASHVGSVIKTNGAWGVLSQQDASASAIVNGQAIGPDPAGYATTGAAMVYLDGTSPYPMVYDDGGAVQNSTAPGVPTSLMPISTGAVGGGGSFTVIGSSPTMSAVYSHTSATDALGAFRLVYSNGGTTYWDSGRVPVSNGPTSGGTFTMPYSGSPTLQLNTTYSVVCYAYDALGNQSSPSSAAVNVYVAGSVPQPLPVTTSFTTLYPTFTFDYYEANIASCGSYDIQITDQTTGAILYDSGFHFPASPITCSYLQSPVTAGSTTITTVSALTPNSTVVLAEGQPGSQVLTVTSVNTGGTYPVATVTPAVTATWGAGTRINTRFTTPGFPFQTALAQDGTYGVTVICTVVPPPNTPAWSGSATGTITTAFPGPPMPDSLVVEPIPGIGPTSGGYLSLRFDQTNGTPTPATETIYLRQTGTTTWTKAASFPTVIGTNTARLYSVRPGIAYDVTVTSMSSDGIESAQATVQTVTLSLRMGLHLCDPSQPKTAAVELGLVPQSNTLPIFDLTVQQDFAALFNRTAPVLTTGSQAAYSQNADITYIYEPGTQQTCQNQLIAWLTAGTTLLVRDATTSLMFYGVLRKASPTAVQHSSISGVVLNIAQTDAGPYTSVVTQ